MKMVFIFSILVLSMLFQSAFAQREIRVGDIQENEVDRIHRRIRSREFSTFGFGPSQSDKSNSGGAMYGLSLGKIWETTETGEIRLHFLGATNAQSQFAGLHLGYGYLPLTGDFSPVFGFELGGAYAAYQDHRTRFASGFDGGVFSGFRFFRTSDTQLELLASYHAVFTEDTPGIYGLQFRILY